MSGDEKTIALLVERAEAAEARVKELEAEVADLINGYREQASNRMRAEAELSLCRAQAASRELETLIADTPAPVEPPKLSPAEVEASWARLRTKLPELPEVKFIRCDSCDGVFPVQDVEHHSPSGINICKPGTGHFRQTEPVDPPKAKEPERFGCCGGNDSTPQGHCSDCSAQQEWARSFGWLPPDEVAKRIQEARDEALEEAAKVAKNSSFDDGPGGSIEGQIADAILELKLGGA